MFKSYIGIALSFFMLMAIPFSTYAIDDGTNDDQTAESYEEKKRLYEEWKNKTLDERVTEKKQEVVVDLVAERNKLVAERCKASQVIISKAVENSNQRYKTRTEIYDKLTARLTSFVGLLDSKSIDTTKLKADLATLQSMIDDFKLAHETAVINLQDLANLDCVNDPAAFQTILESVRTERTSLKNTAVAIREFAQKTIKQDLVDIKNAIEPKTDNTDDSNTDSGASEPVDPDTPVSSPPAEAQTEGGN